MTTTQVLMPFPGPGEEEISGEEATAGGTIEKNEGVRVIEGRRSEEIA